MIFKSLSLIIGKSSVFIVDNLNLERPQFISSKESFSLCEICTSDPPGNLLTISYNVAADTDVSPPILISALMLSEQYISRFVEDRLTKSSDDLIMMLDKIGKVCLTSIIP